MNNYMLLGEFERIVSLKTKIFAYKPQYVDKFDLTLIEEYAQDLGIDNYLTYFDFEDLEDTDNAKEIWTQWCKDISNAFNSIKKEIEKQMIL